MCETADKLKQLIKSKFSPEEIKIYREHFDVFDLNGDGVISARELDKVSKHLGYRMSKEEIYAIMKATDLDASGSLSFQEFLLAMPGNSSIPKDEHKTAEVRRKFMEYDKDRNGLVTVDEAHHILKRELAFTPRQSAKLVEQYDKTGDGQLSYEEFANFYKRVCSKANQVRKLFEEFDSDHSCSVSVQEAKDMLSKLNIPEDEIEGLVSIHDNNKDGELQYEEFVSFLLHS